jgi:hypothetical protein
MKIKFRGNGNTLNSEKYGTHLGTLNKRKALLAAKAC